jgi:hypothetical protein
MSKFNNSTPQKSKAYFEKMKNLHKVMTFMIETFTSDPSGKTFGPTIAANLTDLVTPHAPFDPDWFRAERSHIGCLAYCEFREGIIDATNYRIMYMTPRLLLDKCWGIAKDFRIEMRKGIDHVYYEPDATEVMKKYSKVVKKKKKEKKNKKNEEKTESPTFAEVLTRTPVPSPSPPTVREKVETPKNEPAIRKSWGELCEEEDNK